MDNETPVIFVYLNDDQKILVESVAGFLQVNARLNNEMNQFWLVIILWLLIGQCKWYWYWRIGVKGEMPIHQKSICG